MKTFFDNDKALEAKFGIKKGQTPLTKFIDNIDAVKVEMINWPDPERTKEHLVGFATSSWFENFFKSASQEDIDASIAELMSGKILGQGIEGLTFSFRVSGLSLHGSHAFVRTRIGAAYLQQSQAVQDFRHSDILVPRSFNKMSYPLVKSYFEWVIQGKSIYSSLLDTGDISITDARFALPKTIPVWIYASFSLASLLGIYSKRTDTQEEHPEMNSFAEQMRSLIVEKFPYMDGYFKRDDKCIHKYEGYRSNCVFKRDENHQLKEGQKDNWTFHDKTKQELMLNCDPFKTAYYLGFDEITEEEYSNMKIKYGI